MLSLVIHQGGYQGYKILAVVGLGIKVLVAGGVLGLFYLACLKIDWRQTFGRLTRNIGISIFFGLACVVLLVVLKSLEILFNVLTFRIIDPTEFGQMTQVLAYAELILPIFIPILLLVFMFWLRPRRLNLA